MKETKLYNSKIVDNEISGDTTDGSHVRRPIVKTVDKDLIETHDFLFRLTAGAVPVPPKPVAPAAVHPVIPTPAPHVIKPVAPAPKI